MENQDSKQNNQAENQQNLNWEREVLEKLALSAVEEQRKTRRWGVFFKVLMFVYLIGIGVMAFYPQLEKDFSSNSDKAHTAVVDITGVIAEAELANANNIIAGIRSAYKNKNTKGVVLNINSPGGSPVQASYVFSEIMRLKEKHPDIPIYSVVSDICASGGYYIAAATDKIFVNESSMIGSIGVIMNGFGFVDTMKKLGIDRRLMVSGKHKALMDPFSPVNSDQNTHMQTLMDEVHQQFISAVKAGRGERLQDTADVFSGLVWTGSQGVKLGLADDFGSVDSVAREIIGAKKKLNFTPQEKLLDKMVGKLGISIVQALSMMFQTVSLR